MPVYLNDTNFSSELGSAKSVLIVPCRFCPAATLAVKSQTPYIQPLRGSLKTAVYERFIERMKRSLEGRGIRTELFRSRWLHQFVLCMWTSRRRRQLLRRARRHEAVVVLGCEAAGRTVRDSLESSDCRVVQGMTSEGIMNVKPRLRWPCDLSLELEGVTPLVRPESPS